MTDEVQPGTDWIYVEAGTGLTAEHAAREFLDLNRDDQFQRMQRFLGDSGASASCQTLDHDGAMVLARHYTCQDRYRQGCQDGFADLQRKVDERCRKALEG